MIKKIRVEQLKPGMFIHDFNCGWLQHPFFSSSLKVKDKNMIGKIRDSGIREVYIDTDKGPDVTDAVTREEAEQVVQKEINKLAESGERNRNPVSVREETFKAREIQKEAKQTVQKLMEDIRLGRQIQITQADHVVDKMVDSIFRNKDALTSLGMIKKVDEYTFFHSVSVSVLLIAFSRHLGFDVQTIKIAGIGGLLHDIGKMKVPLGILNKPGKLTHEEFMKVKEHAEQGRIILEQYPDISDLSVFIAAQHHERIDGSGYPKGLKGEEIHKLGRMAAIVDVYDAITSDRCYHRAMLPFEALRKLFEWSEFHFDRNLTENFVRCMGIYPVGTLVRLESGLLGVVLEQGQENLLQPTVRIIYDTRKKKHISPYEVDLSRTSRTGGYDKIADYECPAKWHIKPEEYLLDTRSCLI